MSEDVLTVEKLYGVMRDIEALMTDVVCRFVGYPETVDQLLSMMHAAGVERREASGPLALTGIPFDRDPTIRRGFIEGRNNKGEMIRLFVVVEGKVYEWLELDTYRELAALLPRAPEGGAEGAKRGNTNDDHV